MPYSGGLARNIEQCLNDFNIPLKLSHTVVKIHGDKRLEGVTIAQVDKNRKPMEETKEYIPCDTLLLSVGLIPENELSKKADIELSPITAGAVVDRDRQTSVSGIYACGNVLHVHDLVDFVSEEAEIAGKAAVKYINGKSHNSPAAPISTDGKIRYTVPQTLNTDNDTKVYFRVASIYKNVNINVLRDDGTVVFSKKKQRVAPGEMECITLKSDMIIGAKALRFELEELK